MKGQRGAVSCPHAWDWCFSYFNPGPTVVATEVAHAIPGRVRLRVGESMRSGDEAAALRDRLARIEGIRGIDIRTSTGSVIVHYDEDKRTTVSQGLCEVFPDLDADHLGDRSSSSSANAEEKPLWLAVLGELYARTQGMGRGGAPGIDAKTMVPLALVAFGLLSLLRNLLSSRKLAFPEWYDWIWFGLASYLSLHGTSGAESSPGAPEAAERADAAGDCESTAAGENRSAAAETGNGEKPSTETTVEKSATG